MHAGVMDKLGLGYERVKEVNPRIIFACNSGYGPVGELSKNPSYDGVSQAFTGVMVGQGGGPSHEPVPVDWTFSDEVGAMNFYSAIVTALFARENSSRDLSPRSLLFARCDPEDDDERYAAQLDALGDALWRRQPHLARLAEVRTGAALR